MLEVSWKNSVTRQGSLKAKKKEKKKLEKRKKREWMIFKKAMAFRWKVRCFDRVKPKRKRKTKQKTKKENGAARIKFEKQKTKSDVTRTAGIEEKSIPSLSKSMKNHHSRPWSRNNKRYQGRLENDDISLKKPSKAKEKVG